MAVAEFVQLAAQRVDLLAQRLQPLLRAGSLGVGGIERRPRGVQLGLAALERRRVARKRRGVFLELRRAALQGLGTLGEHSLGVLRLGGEAVALGDARLQPALARDQRDLRVARLRALLFDLRAQRVDLLLQLADFLLARAG